jgi:hypothetical protein
LALPKTSIGPATSSDWAVGVAKTTIFRAAEEPIGMRLSSAIFVMGKI